MENEVYFHRIMSLGIMTNEVNRTNDFAMKFDQILFRLEEQMSNDRKKSERTRARVLYNYRRSAEDELTLNVGDTVTILDKHLDDEGWWKVIGDATLISFVFLFSSSKHLLRVKSTAVSVFFRVRSSLISLKFNAFVFHRLDNYVEEIPSSSVPTKRQTTNIDSSTNYWTKSYLFKSASTNDDESRVFFLTKNLKKSFFSFV